MEFARGFRLQALKAIGHDVSQGSTREGEMLRSGSLFLITLILADSAPHCGGSKDWSTLVLSLDDCSCRFEQVQIYVDNLLEAGGVTIRCGEPFRLRIETESGHHSLSIQSGDAVVFDTGIWTSGGQEQQVNLTCPVD